jgi:hypothetical protein
MQEGLRIGVHLLQELREREVERDISGYIQEKASGSEYFDKDSIRYTNVSKYIPVSNPQNSANVVSNVTPLT